MSVEAVFLKIVNMSAAASWLILAVCLLRLMLKKAPKSIRCVLWGFVGLRLICPFSPESVLSLIPSAETVPVNIMNAAEPKISSGVQAINRAVNPVISSAFTPDPSASVNPLQIVIPAAALLWLAGIAVMLLYAVFSYEKLRRQVAVGMPLERNIWLSDGAESPFILGIFRPRIYLPSTLTEEDRNAVLAHEQAHLVRRDHWWKPLGFAILALHWFNPLVWAAYYLLCRDIEFACDEKVAQDMDAAGRVSYSEALLSCSVKGRVITACPLAFGETGVKERVKTVLNYRKPAFWVTAAALVICVFAAVCFLTDPADSNVEDPLRTFVDCEILNHHQSEKSAEHFCCSDWKLLGKKQSGNTTTLYLWVLYEEYTRDFGDHLKQECGAHIPTVITVEESGGSYRLSEYWEPRDGNYCAPDIRSKFPTRLRAKALDSQRYIDEQLANCQRKAQDYFGIEEWEGSCSYQVFFADEKVCERLPECLNADTMGISAVRHLPVYRVDSLEALRAFCARFPENMESPDDSGDRPLICYADRLYNQTFFDHHSLLLIDTGGACVSHRFGVVSVEEADKRMTVHVMEDSSDGSNATMSYQVIAVTVNRWAAADCERFDADLTETVHLSAYHDTAPDIYDLIPGLQEKEITRITAWYKPITGSLSQPCECGFYHGDEGFDPLLDALGALRFTMREKEIPLENGDYRLMLTVWCGHDCIYRLILDTGGWSLNGHRCAVEGDQAAGRELAELLLPYGRVTDIDY